jgi:endonuclease-3
LRLSENSDPVKLEYDLMEIVPKENWTMFSHLLVFHGRNICNARKPKCQECPINKYCPTGNEPEVYSKKS